MIITGAKGIATGLGCLLTVAIGSSGAVVYEGCSQHNWKLKALTKIMQFHIGDQNCRWIASNNTTEASATPSLWLVSCDAHVSTDT